LIIINKGPTGPDNLAALRLESENTGFILDEIYKHMIGKEENRTAETD
jgi:hypothetical protein